MKKCYKLLPLFARIWVTIASLQHYIYLIRIRPERFFNTDWLILLIPMQWNHFQGWQLGLSYDNSDKFLLIFARIWVAIATLQRNIYLIRLRPERFFNTDWLILFIRMQWNYFQSLSPGEDFFCRNILQVRETLLNPLSPRWTLFCNF